MTILLATFLLREVREGLCCISSNRIREAAKKVFLSGPATKSDGVKGLAAKKEKFPQKMWLLGSRGGGRTKALVAGPLKKKKLRFP